VARAMSSRSERATRYAAMAPRHATQHRAAVARRREKLVAQMTPFDLPQRYKMRFNRTTPPRSMLVENDTLISVGLTECDESEQAFCSGCLIVDLLIGEGEDAVNGLADFYPDEERGFLSYAARFEEGIDNTLVDPFGSDTFTTSPKTVPWVFTRLLRVRWFFLWDYSPLLDILAAAGEEPDFDAFVGETARIQQEQESITGREDIENDAIDIFAVVVQPIITALEMLAATVANTSSVQTLARVFDRFVACDNQGALTCRSDLGVGLFDGIMNALLIVLILVVFVRFLVPFDEVALLCAAALAMIVATIFVVLAIWIAYNVSPLCLIATLPLPIPFTPFAVPPIMGVPTCLPSDIYTLSSELLPQCSPFTVPSLIDPSARFEASQTLCAECGTAPPLLDCATAANFQNFLDNIFYTTTLVLGESVNAQIADSTASLLPDLS